MPPTPEDNIRPTLTPEILKCHTMEEYTRLLEIFYLQFRRKEKFDDFNGYKPRARLDQMYSCYFEEFNKTLEYANKYPHVLHMKKLERLICKPLPKSLFNSFLHECDYQYMIKRPVGWCGVVCQ